MRRAGHEYKSLPYRPDIDGLRAISILLAVAFHARPWLAPGGFVGVDVFFVISGFLITGIVLRELAGRSFSLRTFYGRRIRRIFPARNSSTSSGRPCSGCCSDPSGGVSAASLPSA